MAEIPPALPPPPPAAEHHLKNANDKQQNNAVPPPSLPPPTNGSFLPAAAIPEGSTRSGFSEKPAPPMPPQSPTAQSPHPVLTNGVKRRFTIQVDHVGQDPGFDFYHDAKKNEVWIVAVSAGSPMERAGVVPTARFISFNGQSVTGQETLQGAIRGWVESRRLSAEMELFHDPNTPEPNHKTAAPLPPTRGPSSGGSYSELPFDPHQLSPNVTSYTVRKGAGETSLGMIFHTYGDEYNVSPVYLVGNDPGLPFARSNVPVGEIVSLAGIDISCKADLRAAVKSVEGVTSFPITLRQPADATRHPPGVKMVSIMRGNGEERLGVEYTETPDGVFSQEYANSSPFRRAGAPLGQIVSIDGVDIYDGDDMVRAKRKLDDRGAINFTVAIRPCAPPVIKRAAPLPPNRDSIDPDATPVERLSAELKVLATQRRKGLISEDKYLKMKAAIVNVLNEHEPTVQTRKEPPSNRARVVSSRKVLLRSSPEAGSGFVHGSGVYGTVAVQSLAPGGWVWVRSLDPKVELQEGFIREAHLQYVNSENPPVSRPSRRGHSRHSPRAERQGSGQLNGLLGRVLSEIGDTDSTGTGRNLARNISSDDGVVAVDEHFDPITGQWRPTYVRRGWGMRQHADGAYAPPQAAMRAARAQEVL